MTLLDIKNQLFTHFLNKDSFIMSTDLDFIKVDDELLGRKREIVKSALKLFETAGVIEKVSRDDSDDECWIVIQPTEDLSQTISVSFQASELIADVINSYREANGIKENPCDKANIKERDLLNLVNICHSLLER